MQLALVLLHLAVDALEARLADAVVARLIVHTRLVLVAQARLRCAIVDGRFASESSESCSLVETTF